MSESVKLLSAQDVAEVFVDGIIKQKPAILPGEAGLVWSLFRFFHWLVRWITDNQFQQARRKLGQEA